MNCTLMGIKKIDYTNRATGELKSGLELHCERKPFPTENFLPGSSVCFTQYLANNANTSDLVAKVLNIPLMSEISLVFVQNGRYSTFVDVEYTP
ncbi:MAG: hypothetical protein J1E34_03315 [Oscillospiraceae bacterium]|nr:hypothetical protein [Oscillospiraceae bacterium]